MVKIQEVLCVDVLPPFVPTVTMHPGLLSKNKDQESTSKPDNQCDQEKFTSFCIWFGCHQELFVTQRNRL